VSTGAQYPRLCPAPGRAADEPARYSVPLAANQVQCSLRHREPETDGVLDACRRMDVALVAYRPIGGGASSAGSPSGAGQPALADTLREAAATPNVAMFSLLRVGSATGGAKGQRCIRDPLCHARPLGALMRKGTEAHGASSTTR
jgi:aryl-alcohol dehydrogenase-like predicted oxidoreductase